VKRAFLLPGPAIPSRFYLAEVTPVRRNEEERTSDCERHTCDDRSRVAQLELRDLCGGKPDPGEQHKQEPDFGEAQARPVCKTKKV
jgi:hypothetical protein